MYLLKYIEKAEKIMRKTYTIFLCHVWGHPLTTWKHFLGVFDHLTPSWTLLLNTRCLSTDPTKVEAFYAHLGLNL